MDFRRDQGEGGRAQRWIDDNLPVCPLCRTPSVWTFAEGGDEPALLRWYFRCSNCKSVLSVIADNPVQAFAEPAMATNVPITKDVRVDSAGRKEDEDFVGEEFPLYELQNWAEDTES